MCRLKLSKMKGKVGESDSFHKGYDKIIKKEPLNMQFSGKIVDLDTSGLPEGDWKNTSGKNVNFEIGFMYENLFISTGIQNNSFHLDSPQKIQTNFGGGLLYHSN